MNRGRRDLDDDDLLDREVAKDQHAERAEQSARLEAGERRQLEVEARRKVATTAWVRAANAGHVEDSYRAAGVEPPPLEEGQTRCSLSLLLSVGWRVEELPDGSRALVRPPPLPKVDRPSGYRITTPEPQKKPEGKKQ